MPVRFGIIGCGMIADFHARAIADVETAELTACCSRNPQSAKDFARQHQCHSFPSTREMLASDQIDAVSICSPSGAHLDPAILAAKAGKHVIVEKPLEITTQRCDQIIEACQRHGVIVSTIFQARFHESSRRLKQAVEQQRFGTLSLANAYVKWFRTQEYYDSGQWRGTWDLDGGGALMNQAIHNVDLLQWMMGPVQKVSAFSATLAHERIEVEDTIVANLRFKNGALGTIEATTSAFPGSLKRLEIYGSTGSAVIEDENISKWEFGQPTDEDQLVLDEFANRNLTTGGASDPSAIDYSAHRAQFQDIVQAIELNRQPMIDGHEGRKSVEIIEAVYRSANSGSVVELPH